MKAEAERTLVVDLDGTLLRSDMLFESFWSSLAGNWRSLFDAMRALPAGRAALKHQLAGTARINFATLPYDAGVLDYVRRWRAGGGATALVTGADRAMAEAVSDQLGLFDHVYGSEAGHNLKGDAKARFLQERFGPGNFAYMGDASVDLPVWAVAERSITVNAPDRLRAAVERISDNVEHLGAAASARSAYLRAIRPHQWLKNILVFLPLLTAHRFDMATLLLSCLAFISFSLVASSVYVLNDLLDLDADRAHPRKCRRPFASGAIPISAGSWMALGLLLGGVACALAIGPLFLLVMLGYYALTTGYSLYLKRRMVIDICVLAGLYTVRIVAGGAATGIPLSFWLLTFSVFFFLSLAAAKRQAELVDGAARGQSQAHGRGYFAEDLPVITMIALASGYVSVQVMALYVNSPDVTELYSCPEALWAICAVLIYWITRVVMLAHRGQMPDDPVIFAVKDWTSRLCFAVILGFAVAGVFL